MSIEVIKEAYEQLNEATLSLQGALDFSYIEALHENLQNLANQEVQQIDGLPDDATIAQIKTNYKRINALSLDDEAIRKVIQLAFLEGDRRDQLPANYQMTPEAIALLMGYFAVKVLGLKQEADQSVQLFDPTIGSGNLWAIVYKELQKNGFQVSGEGYDNDDLLLAIADQSFKLQDLSPNLFLGDALGNLLIQPADLVVADLPVGYYPLNEVAQNYNAANTEEEGLSYSHYLLIEQSLNYLKADGWGIFLVPNTIITDSTMPQLIQAINQKGYFQALLSLPQSLFRSHKAQKAIMFVQAKGEQSKQDENVLVGEIPDLKDTQRMPQFLKSFDNWLQSLKN
ncbi:class I SAM-dependent methyltransferase [Aerococcus kribbianus]|uniref:Class I SAM-dependent methyltransferase n=1 Tax=Aerococcus kribbianus TaxID=2999064 RepID=A0A9X3JEK1_9LACT|nr:MULTISPECIES: class I SAM-dependent methyltransferase [unclassified Aerococcus]MCZ0716688.1 class I SAM-dependent methyltransferase [Aerococcus sp. YH-aer221]MCZ0724976.1 class I SAM-dependent methyltransferase [Aerococcus sp. YH-aer222]